MLVDRTNNQTYSSRIEAIRQIGQREFFLRVKNNQITYVQCYLDK